jgi:lysozyme
MAEGVDISTWQGNYTPPANVEFVIANASRANNGSLQTGDHYIPQINAARALEKDVGHYFFNGNIDPAVCADFFVTHLHDFRYGELIAIDTEDEPSTGTVAWNPVQVNRFLDRVASILRIPRTATAVYMNRNVRSRYDWSGVWATGTRKWISSPGTDPGDWDIWQYSFTPLDLDRTRVPLSDLAAVANVTPTTKEDEDVNGFYVKAINADKFYWFSPSTGKLRTISSTEWSLLRAVESTKTAGDTIDVVLPIINVSQAWINSASKL